MAVLPAATHMMNILAYAPIALFAESLRVQHAMALSILTRNSIAPAMTGCIKDLQFLWEMNDTQLFGSFDERDTAHVASVRHGNTFRLQNQAVLILGQILGRRCGARIVPYTPGIGEFTTRRETVLNLTFVLPNAAAVNGETVKFGQLECLCILVSVVEVGAAILIAVCMAINEAIVGMILMLCISLAVVGLGVLRYFTSPIIANQSAIARDLQDMSPTLDTHVIARHWNDTHLDVVCGYTSHLHALTNIPMVIDRSPLLRWISRMVAVILVIQAASLASLLGTKENTWISLVWITLYLFMLLPPRLLGHYAPDLPHKKHSATVTRIPPICFSCRKAALLFVTLLPVSKRSDIDRWAWMDVYLPDNDRRRRWRDQVEAQDIASGKSIYSNNVKETLSEKDGEDDMRAIVALQEADTAYNHPQVLQPLLAYLSSLGGKYARISK